MKKTFILYSLLSSLSLYSASAPPSDIDPDLIVDLTTSNTSDGAAEGVKKSKSVKPFILHLVRIINQELKEEEPFISLVEHNEVKDCYQIYIPDKDIFETKYNIYYQHATKDNRQIKMESFVRQLHFYVWV